MEEIFFSLLPADPPSIAILFGSTKFSFAKYSAAATVSSTSAIPQFLSNRFL